MRRKKILLFGSTGMAGHVAYLYLKATGKYEITNVVYRTKFNDESVILDITNKEETEALILSHEPDIILNCIGILIKGSQEFPDNAIYINAYFPHLLERIASNINAKLIHISTDCVFSGKKGDYKENDERDADDIYGKSKALGEVINDKDLTIRTSIIGPELKQNGEGLFHWFMKQKGEINGFTKAFWSGVTTLELAKAINATIEQNITGLIHLTNGEKIAKYDLLLLFKEIWKVDKVQINLAEGKSVDKSLSQTSKNFKYNVPPYNKMLQEQKEFMNVNNKLYTQYQ